ncbi:hypothetical protein BMS3Bbin04_01997 [bacterium BMS3Bbin04]|nr:hypothetical protein BMS3Bbin04_01997 [bacterium BMS3Bbin04]
MVKCGEIFVVNGLKCRLVEKTKPRIIAMRLDCRVCVNKIAHGGHGMRIGRKHLSITEAIIKVFFYLVELDFLYGVQFVERADHQRITGFVQRDDSSQEQWSNTN